MKSSEFWVTTVNTNPAPFWERKTLSQMSEAEWESLCDGCGRCCLQKLRCEDDDSVMYTRVACQLLDPQTCRCRDYENRQEKVAECISLNADNTEALQWLPKSCAYVRIHNGEGLADWHPLVSGDAQSVHRAGISMSGQVVSETWIHPDEIETLVIDFGPD